MSDTENPAEYEINHWRLHETATEHAERVQRAEQEADRLFWQVPAVIKANAEYQQLLQDLQGLRGPKYNRRKIEALSRWRHGTKVVRDLYNRTCDAIMRDGEYGDDINRAWDFLIDPVRAATFWAAEQVAA